MARTKSIIDPEIVANLQRANSKLRNDLQVADAKLMAMHHLAIKIVDAHKSNDSAALSALFEELKKVSYFQPF